jgi:hypothetical protein
MGATEVDTAGGNTFQVGWIEHIFYYTQILPFVKPT